MMGTKLFSFRDTVEYRQRTFTVYGSRGKSKHWLKVSDGRTRREFELAGRFGRELSNKAVERFCGMES